MLIIIVGACAEVDGGQTTSCAILVGGARFDGGLKFDHTNGCGRLTPRAKCFGGGRWLLLAVGRSVLSNTLGFKRDLPAEQNVRFMGSSRVTRRSFSFGLNGLTFFTGAFVVSASLLLFSLSENFKSISKISSPGSNGGYTIFFGDDGGVMTLVIVRLGTFFWNFKFYWVFQLFFPTQWFVS